MFQNIILDPNSGVRFHNLLPGHRIQFVNFLDFAFVFEFWGWLPPADRQRVSVQRPKTISKYLLLVLVGSKSFILCATLFVHVT